MRSLVFLVAIAATLALADTPSHASPPSNQDASASESGERPAQQVATEATANADNKANSEFKPPAGYQKRVRNGQEVYCRNIVPPGSHIRRTECFTEAQIVSIEQAQRAYREDMRKQGLICADQRCNGG